MGELRDYEPSGDKSHGGGGGRAKWGLDGDGGTDMNLVLPRGGGGMEVHV